MREESWRACKKKRMTTSLLSGATRAKTRRWLRFGPAPQCAWISVTCSCGSRVFLSSFNALSKNSLHYVRFYGCCGRRLGCASLAVSIQSPASIASPHNTGSKNRSENASAVVVATRW
eukprot:scaffold96577_cov69-Phaeocystis_antarctica.AAC.2